MERHAISQQERQRRSSYYVATSTAIERMNSNDEYRRRRQSSASSSGASSRRSSVIDGRFRHESLTVESGDNDRGEKQRNDFYLNLPLLLWNVTMCRKGHFPEWVYSNIKEYIRPHCCLLPR